MKSLSRYLRRSRSSVSSEVWLRRWSERADTWVSFSRLRFWPRSAQPGLPQLGQVTWLWAWASRSMCEHTSQNRHSSICELLRPPVST